MKHLNILLEHETWESVYKHKNINSACETFVKVLKFYVDIAIPIKKVKINQCKKSWITLGIKTSSKNLKLLSKFSKTTHNPEIQTYFRKYKKIYRKVINEAKRMHNDIYIRTANNKTKAMWQIVRDELSLNNNYNTSQFSITNAHGQLTSDPATVATIFNDHYSAVAEKIIPVDNDQTVNPQNFRPKIIKNEQSFYLYPVTREEILAIIRKISNKNSIGIDEIPSSLIKKCSKHLADPLCYLANTSLSTGEFPNNLKRAIIKPIHKKGSTEKVENYRPISLLSPISKILEKIIFNRLMSFLRRFNIIAPQQHGFIKGKCIETAVYKFIEDTRQILDTGNNCIGIFLDLTKAFDVVNHCLLLNKLENYGIRGTALDWFRSYLSNRDHIVQVQQLNILANAFKKYTSEPRPVKYGVPQGSVLGPLLFLLFINDLPLNIDAECTLFADDTNILITGENEHILKENITLVTQQLSKWFKANGLILNESKTIAVSFHHRMNKRTLKPDISFEKNIQYAEFTKFLGINIEEHLSWDLHIGTVAKKLGKFKYAIQIIKHKTNLVTTRTLYFAYVHSLLRYGIIFWGNSSKCQTIFKIQKRIIRIMSGAKHRDSCRPLFQNLKIMPLPCIYIYELILYVKTNLKDFKTNDSIHNHNTRTSNKLSIPTHHTSLFQKGAHYNGIKLFNKLPLYLKNIHSVEKFKKTLKEILLQICCYNVEEYYEFISTYDKDHD